MFNWMDFNHDGRVDAGEEFIAYMQYKEIFANEEEEYDEDSDEDD